ncbi:hypothetical protein B0920_09905 [Massilia sp. KIM]|uniref:methyl-accepting chemotaxis protein n=1 Tax=Massilia sp. KIM TaxID=1955422 RepID=UPI00098F3B30|nr:methyl-accepting chemotaxis protein [Massilia sp. KIM]OON63647.1 hypothetical protein B0920_09905 [Massilia sp. KIM]
MTISHLSIIARLRLGFGIVFASLALVAGVGLYELNRANKALDRLAELNLVKIELLADMSDAVHTVSRVVRSMALLQDREAAERERLKIDKARASYDEAASALAAMPLDAAGQDFVRRIEESRTLVRPLNDRFLALSAAGDPQAVAYLLGTVGPATTQWQDLLHDFMDLQRRKGAEDAAAAHAAYRKAWMLMGGIALLALTGGTLIALQISRSIGSSVSAAVQLARTVEAGDLRTEVDVHGRDRSETGSLLRALNGMSGALNGVVGQVREGARTLAVYSQEIAQGNLDLSGRTEEQASALEETASSMEELSATVKQNADNAQAASTMASNAALIAEEGGKTVRQVVAKMDHIANSSSRIVEITSVIDGIAFQTNILALNAAVEAARAGEQGRGFAVVAGEVRTLAQRSSTAAQEIKALIDESVQEIRSGSTLAREAGATMNEIVHGIAQVSRLITDIAAASKEQAVGIEQTYGAVSELDQITQRNAALVEELAATAGALESEAAALEKVVARFQLAVRPAALAANTRLLAA